ncbi:hypothetical protein ACJEJR_19900, partial [Escherichia coli]
MIPDRERTTGSLFERMEASSARNRQGGSIHSLRQSIRQNLRNILNTRSGSCRGAPELGIDEPEGAENFRGHCCKVSDEAAFCLIQRPYISKTLLT